MKLFYDTCAFCALAIPEDTNHATAKTALEQALVQNPRQFTSSYVLD